MPVEPLPDEKFRLFDGVFGASDEVLGAVESGVDFEKRIATIYQRCRTPEQIQFEFDALQQELEIDIAEGQRDAREKLLDNFDEEVVERVRLQSSAVLDRFNEQLWQLTKHLLSKDADFDDEHLSFTLRTNPVPAEVIHSGPYRMGKDVEDANTYRVGHPLAQHVLAQGRELDLAPAEVAFDYRASGKNIVALDALKGVRGWLTCSRTTVRALETEDVVVFSGVCDDGTILDDVQCRRLFDLSGQVGDACEMRQDTARALDELQARRREQILADLIERNGNWFDVEIDKLDRWAEDRRTSLQAALGELDDSLKEARKAARVAPTLPDKLVRQRTVRELEGKRDNAWREYDQASREIDREKDTLLDEISRRLEQTIDHEPLFALRWALT